MLPLQVQLATCSYYKEMSFLGPLSLEHRFHWPVPWAATERALFYFTKGHLTLLKSPTAVSLSCLSPVEKQVLTACWACLVGLLSWPVPASGMHQSRFGAHLEWLKIAGSCDLVALDCQSLSLTHFTKLWRANHPGCLMPFVLGKV